MLLEAFSDKALLNSLLPLISETPRLIYSNQRDWHQTWVSFSQKLLDAATAIRVPMALHGPQDQGRGQVCFTSHTPRLRPGKGACIPTPADLSRRADGRSLVSAARTSLQKGSHQGIPRDQEHYNALLATIPHPLQVNPRTLILGPGSVSPQTRTDPLGCVTSHGFQSINFSRD